MIFNDLAKGKTVKGGDKNSSDEEQYQRMFKKIARDFVHREDLKEILRELFLGLSLFDEGLDYILKDINIEKKIDNAIDKAIEYRENLEKPKHKRKTYRDIDDE
jgi:hypothetical protein